MQNEPKEIKMSLPVFAIRLLWAGAKAGYITFKAARAIAKIKKAEMSNFYYPRFAYLPVKTEHEWIWVKRYYEMKMPLLKGGYEFKKITEMDYAYLKLQGKTSRTGFADSNAPNSHDPWGG